MRRFQTWAAALALTSAAVAPAALAQKSADLQDYLAKPSPHYHIINTKKSDKTDGLWRYEVMFQSVKWRGEDEVSKPIWTHKLIIFTPDKFKKDTIVLGVGGGVNGFDNETAQREQQRAKEIAQKSGFASALVATVPNQPLQFMADGKDRYEDDIIAYSWDKYLRTLDSGWLPLFPMVKSTKLAMDAVLETLQVEFPEFRGSKFVLWGNSKRGWTTWLTGATDKRVAGIAPTVIDILNMKPNLKNHYASLGEWSVALQDYVHHKITERIDTKEMDEAIKRLDPLSYANLLRLPKLILSAGNDQFFTPDSSTFYYDQLPGPKWIRYFPNNGHSLNNADLTTPIATFAKYVTKPDQLAPMTWNLDADGKMTYTAKHAPSKIVLWEAVNPKKKDFRLMSADFPRYVPTELSPTQKVFTVSRPTQGFKSFFYEFTFKLPEGGEFVQTTSARILAH